MKAFTDHTATYKDSDGDEHESTIRARISDGDETVNTLAGQHAVNRGDAVIERPDAPGVYDVLTADAWKDTGYGSNETVTVDDDNDDDDDDDGDNDNPQRPAFTGSGI